MEIPTEQENQNILLNEDNQQEHNNTSDQNPSNSLKRSAWFINSQDDDNIIDIPEIQDINSQPDDITEENKNDNEQ